MYAHVYVRMFLTCNIPYSEAKIRPIHLEQLLYTCVCIQSRALLQQNILMLQISKPHTYVHTLKILL